VITAEGLAVVFAEERGGGAQRVLDDVAFRAERGEIVGLIGPPASGKTVLLKVLAGLIEPAAGRLAVDGEEIPATDDAGRAAWQRRIGMAFQNDALFDAMTVFENVAFPLRRRRVPADEIEARARRRLRDVELEEAGDKLPSEISGGMRKRAGIARATVIDPELGLFDDPIAGLDPVTGGNILDFIVRLTASLNMASVVISNDLAVLLPICARVVMLNEGRVVYDGEPDGLVTSPRPEVVQFALGRDAGPL